MNEKTYIREKLALGELPQGFPLPWTEEEQKSIREDIRKSDEEILAQYSPALMAARIQAAAEAQISEAPGSRPLNRS